MNDWKARAKKAIKDNPNLTQESVAESLGVTQGALGHWLNGRREPSLEGIQLIADAINVNFADLINPSDMRDLFAVDHKALANLGATPIISNRDFTEVPIMEAINLASPTGKTTIIVGEKSPRAIGVSVSDESMNPVFMLGCVVVSDPEDEIKVGDYVISNPIDGEARIGKLVKYGSNYMIMPIDRDYPKFEISNIDQQVFGRISSSTMNY